MESSASQALQRLITFVVKLELHFDKAVIVSLHELDMSIPLSWSYFCVANFQNLGKLSLLDPSVDLVPVSILMSYWELRPVICLGIEF
jgi:hypothetical protein